MGVSCQACCHPGPRGVVCRPRLGFSCQSQGSLPPGTPLLWPTGDALSLSADSNPCVGLTRDGKWGVVTLQQKPPGLKAMAGLAPKGWACFWLEGSGPLRPSCRTCCYEDPLSILSLQGARIKGSRAHRENAPPGTLSLFNCPPTCANPKPLTAPSFHLRTLREGRLDHKAALEMRGLLGPHLGKDSRLPVASSAQDTPCREGQI